MKNTLVPKIFGFAKILCFCILSTHLSVGEIVHVAYKKYKLKENILYFSVNTRYISSRELKTSEFLRVRSTSENSDVFNTLDHLKKYICSISLCLLPNRLYTEYFFLFLLCHELQNY